MICFFVCKSGDKKQPLILFEEELMILLSRRNICSVLWYDHRVWCFAIKGFLLIDTAGQVLFLDGLGVFSFKRFICIPVCLPTRTAGNNAIAIVREALRPRESYNQHSASFTL